MADRHTLSARGVWVVGGALAAQAAMVGVPWFLAEGQDVMMRQGSLSLSALFFLGYGVTQRSAWALLVGVPLGWSLALFNLPHTAFHGPVGWAALGTAAAYFSGALAYLKPTESAIASVEWAALEGPVSATPGRVLSWTAAFLVVGPAVGVAFWPVVPQQIARGFPESPGRAMVALLLMVVLVGLALVTDLARGRTPLRGRWRRALFLAGVGTVLVLGGWMSAW